MTFRERYIHKEISIAPLVNFRVLFGFIMAVSLIRFAAYGWIEDLYISPTFYFSYAGFEWIQPLGSIGTYILFSIMLASAIGIFLGLFYRYTSVLFFLTFTYVELIDKTNYLNHYYFVSLVAFLLIWVPAHRSWSVDVAREAVKSLKYVPAWTINIFKFQLVIVYFFAGLAKINPYWLFEAMPLKLWLPAKSHIPLVGSILQYEWVAYMFSWTGMFYDLTIAFFLIWKRTRVPAFITVIIFHLLTALLFQIGMFPYIMILSTLIFFSADKHEQIQARLQKLTGIFQTTSVTHPNTLRPEMPATLKFAILIPFFIIQVILPFRYLAYPGDLFWTEQGYRFSWRVMLMEKAGFTTFRVVDAEGNTEWINNMKYLNAQQEKMMSTQPDMILQFAHFLKQEYNEKGFVQPKVYCDSKVALNGRRSQVFIDPNVDLGSIEMDFRNKEWITEFKK